MATNPVVKMMHSLSNYSFEDLKTIAKREYVTIPEHISKVELITLIITARNDLDVRKSMYEMMKDNNDNRRKYCLRCEDTDPYFLKLTLDQYNFLDWCIRNEIYLPHAEVDEIDDVEWETP